MAWWAPTNADLRRVLGNKEEFSSEDELGAIPGASRAVGLRRQESISASHRGHPHR